MKKETKKTIKVIIITIIILSIFIGGLGFIIWDAEKNKIKAESCIEQYPLDSCELYKCRAENSNTISYSLFNLRNYEMCKIILNNNMSFNESLDLLNTITYDTVR